ncbi:MAG: diguanylate cyclase [Ruminococcus sp.]|nr:diguanylate cyclase [Ruminococcus sp.]
MDNRLLKITNPSVLIPADESGDLYRDLFNSMHDGISVFEVKGGKVKALYLNERYFDSVGYTMEQYLPYIDNITVTLFEDDEKRIFEHAAECIETGSDFYCNVRGYRFDGSVGQFSVHAKLVDFIKSEYPVFLAAVNDISDINQMYNDLNIAKERCRLLESICTAPIFEYGCADDTMICTNINAAGRTVIENYNMYLRRCDYINPDDISYYYNCLCRACRKEYKGSMDIRIIQDGHKDYSMYRIHYASITDAYGQVINVIGRIESSGCTKSSYEACLCGSEINEIKTAVAENRSRCYMAVAGIDGFEEFREDFGSAEGDEIIRKITDMLKKAYKSAVIFRYYVDEFVIFITDISEVQFYEMTEEFISGTENIILDSGVNAGLSVSMGAAWTVNDGKADFNDYYITAEKALLKAGIDEKNKLWVEKIIY